MGVSASQAKVFLESMLGAAKTAGKQAARGLAGGKATQAIVFPAAGALIGATGNYLQGKDPWRGAAAGALVGGGAFAFRHGYAQRAGRYAWKKLGTDRQVRLLNMRNNTSSYMRGRWQSMNPAQRNRFARSAVAGLGAGSLAYGVGVDVGDYRRAQSQGRNPWTGVLRANVGHNVMTGGLVGAALYGAGRIL